MHAALIRKVIKLLIMQTRVMDAIDQFGGVTRVTRELLFFAKYFNAIIFYHVTPTHPIIFLLQGWHV